MKALASANVPVVGRDFFAERLSIEEVRRIAARCSADEMFSWNSPSARDFKARRGKLTDDDLIALMANEPRFVRRPFMIREGRVVFGFRAGVAPYP